MKTVCIFTFMTAIETYTKKKTDIETKLKVLSAKKIGNRKTMEVCELVGKELNISSQTVYNYISGRISDGYMAEAIYQEFMKLRTPR